MVIDIIGYYGVNFGDLLMLQGLLNSLPAKYEKVNILSYDDLDISKLNILCKADIHSYNIRMPLLKLAILFKEADVLMWGGGSCFNDIDGTGGVKQMYFAKIINPKIKIVYYGVGIDIKNNRKHYAYLKAALFISSRFAVRDLKSYEMIRKFKCSELIEDPIYLNKEWLDNIKAENIDRKLFISYRCVDKYYPNTYSIYLRWFIDNIVNLIEMNHFSNVCIMSADGRVDKVDNLSIINSIYKTSANVISNLEAFSLKDICSHIKSSSLVVTGRLHIAAIASFYNVPYLLLNYSEKNRQFTIKENKTERLVEYVSLKDCGYLSQCVDSMKITK